MLASTERSLEIERQRRSQLRRADQLRGNGHNVAGSRVAASTEFSSQRSSEQFVNLKGCSTTTTALTRNVSQSAVADSTDERKLISNDCLNNTSGDTPYTENWKNGNKPAIGAIVKRYKSTIGDLATSSGKSFTTNFGVDEVGEVRSAARNTGTFKRRTNDSHMRSDRESHSADGLSTFPTRRWSSLKELSGGAALDHRSNSSDSRGVSDRRTSRLDRRVYQCYFAGILHSSRRSERFVRLQQLYSLLENVVEMESEVLSLRRLITPSVTNYQGGKSPHSNHVIDPALQKHLRQRSLELKKLYAKLDAAQDDKEFFYENGRIDAFQWKSWKDLGLSRTSASLTKLKDLFEAAVFDSHSAISTSTLQLQRVERGLSYRKLLGMFRQLEKRTRKETEAWLRWQASSQQSMSSGHSLDGTYIKIMESSARNAKTLALHGYHMDEHRNRYDAYVQSRRIYRPKSSHSIFEQQSSDDPLETDEAASSDLTTPASSLCGSTRYCDENSDALVEKSDCSHIISSSLTSIGSASHCTASKQSADSCTEAKAAVCAEDVRESLPKVVKCKETLTERQVIDNKGVSVDELDTITVKLDSRSKQKSRKRERQRPRRRNQNGTTVQRMDTRSAVPGNAGRRHIEAWRRSSRPLSDTLNQALTYFNSLCIDNSNDKNDCPAQHNCYSVVSPNDNREAQNETNDDATIFDQMTPASGTSTENVELPIAQFSDCENKFLSEINQNVSSGESVGVPSRRKVMLPQLYSCGGDARGADVPSSNVTSLPPPTCFKGVNIDKHRSQATVDAMEPKSHSRIYADGETKKTKAETADTRSVTSHSDVTPVPEVHPTYVRSAPVVSMLSESQPIKTIPVSSPKFVDCRQAIVRKLPTSIYQSYQKSADCQPLISDCMISPASTPAVYTDAISTRKFAAADRLCHDDEPKQTVEKNHCSKSDAGIVASMAAKAACQRNRLSYVRTNVTYITAIDSSSFICRRCCRSLAACSCKLTAEASSQCANDDRSDIVGYGICRRTNDVDNFTQTNRDRHQPTVMGSVHPWVIENKSGPGPQDVEMRRMMNSLAMIDSEWTSGKPTRLTHPVHVPSDMKNNGQSRQQKNGSVSDERGLTLGHLSQCEIC